MAAKCRDKEVFIEGKVRSTAADDIHMIYRSDGGGWPGRECSVLMLY